MPLNRLCFSLIRLLRRWSQQWQIIQNLTFNLTCNITSYLQIKLSISAGYQIPFLSWISPLAWQIAESGGGGRNDPLATAGRVHEHPNGMRDNTPPYGGKDSPTPSDFLDNSKSTTDTDAKTFSTLFRSIRRLPSKFQKTRCETFEKTVFWWCQAPQFLVRNGQIFESP